MAGTNKKIIVVAQENICHNTGGSITCTATLSNLLANNGYEVKIIYYSNRDGEFNLLNNNVELINLNDKNSNTSFSDSANKFVELYNPDLIIFFFPHLYVQVALEDKFKDIPRILMFHSRPDFYFAVENNLEEKLEYLYVNTTSIILFDSYYNLLPKFIQNGKVTTIPNAICRNQARINTDIEHKKIVFFSRIDGWKGIEFLLNSFKLVVKKYSDWQLDLYGDVDSKYKEELLDLTKKLKLTNNVNFKGIIHNPLEVLKEYDFAVFPSYFEGFPIGLLEKLSIGLPCVGLKCCSGVNELIIDDYNGYLTDDENNDFAQKIEKLIENPKLRKIFSQNAMLESSKYNKETIDKKWLEVITQLINNNAYFNNAKYNTNNKKSLFPMSKIINLNKTKEKLKWYQYIFSIKNSQNKKHKIIIILGIKIKIRRKK